LPSHSAHREQGHPRAGGKRKIKPGRHMRRRVGLSHQDDGPVRMSHHHRHRGQQVIHPSTQKSDPDDQRRRY